MVVKKSFLQQKLIYYTEKEDLQPMSNEPSVSEFVSCLKKMIENEGGSMRKKFAVVLDLSFWKHYEDIICKVLHFSIKLI